MIPILVILATMATVLGIMKDEYVDFRRAGDWGFTAAFLALFGFCYSVVGVIAFMFMTLFVTPHEVSRANCITEIMSLRNDTSMSGSFFLGSGSIGSSEYYYMFAKEPDGAVRRLRLNVNESSLYQDSPTNPRVTWQIVNQEFPAWMTIKPVHFSTTTRYDIHVPPNTVVEQFRA